MSIASAEPEFGGGPRHFVRALWGVDLSVSPLPGASELAPRRPRFIGSRVWLPGSSLTGVPGSFASYSLAAAAHIAAHLSFGGERFVVGTLKPIQIAIISLLEDARVERLATARYPGLFRLWAPFHEARPGGAKTSGALLARLARALHDEAFRDDDGWVSSARTAFFADPSALHDARFVRELGGRLGNDLGQMRVQLNAKDYVVQPAYRDDNIGLWQFEQQSEPDGTALELEAARRKEDERAHEAPAREQSQASAEPSEATRPLTVRRQQAAAALACVRYPEWDYVIARERAEFCTLQEKVAKPGDTAPLAAALIGFSPIRRRLRRFAARLGEPRPAHERRLTHGPRLDLPAVIAALLARASDARPDARVYRRVAFRCEPPALLVLLDCSESLNAKAAGSPGTVLEHARAASALLAESLAGTTHDWAIHGFSSNGRHDVGYFRFKDFDEPFGASARARLAGMRAGLSTRPGAALRHAGEALCARAARRKLLLVVSDGEPSDVDVHDAQYLAFDAKRATEQNRHRGVASFCLALDSSAERSVRRVFGNKNYVLMDRLEQLPEMLARSYVRLAG